MCGRGCAWQRLEAQRLEAEVEATAGKMAGGVGGRGAREFA